MEHNQSYGQHLPYLPQQSPWIDHIGYSSHNTSPVHEYPGYAFGSHPMAAEPMYSHSNQHLGRAAHQQLQPLVMPQWPSMIASQGSAPTQYPDPTAAPPSASPQSGTSHGPAHILPAPAAAPSQLSSSPPSHHGSSPRRTLSDADRRRMCQYAEENPTKKQTEIGEIFGVERSTVSKVLRQKDKYLQHDEGSKSPIKRTKGKFPDIERALTIWAKNQESKGFQLTDDMIRRQAKFFSATVLGGAEALAKMNSTSWMEKFKQKNGLMGFKARKGSMASDTPMFDDVLESASAVSPSALSRTASPTISPQEVPSAVERPKFRRPFHSVSHTSLARVMTEDASAPFSTDTNDTNSPLFTPDATDSNMDPYFPMMTGEDPSQLKYRQRSQTFPFSAGEHYISPAPSSQSHTPELSSRTTAAGSAFAKEKSPNTDMPPPQVPGTNQQPASTAANNTIGSEAMPNANSTAPSSGSTTSTSPISPTASPHSSSDSSPSSEDARRALELFLKYCDNNPSAAHVVEMKEYVAIGKLMGKVQQQQQQQKQQRRDSIKISTGPSPAPNGLVGHGDSDEASRVLSTNALPRASNGDMQALPGGLHRIPEHELSPLSRQASSGTLNGLGVPEHVI